MTSYDFDLQQCIDSLKNKRRVFHSEADFQFALAWEIKLAYPEAEVRLEYCPKLAPKMHLDLIVNRDGLRFPIELKYKTKGFEWSSANEAFHLKSHGAQDIGKYDCLIDIMRIEQLSTILPDFGLGYVVWLTNDASYWNPLKKCDAICKDFSLHEGIRKSGSMHWAANAGSGTTKNREQEILLQGTYQIHWHDYSSFTQHKNGNFRYVLVEIAKT